MRVRLLRQARQCARGYAFDAALRERLRVRCESRSLDYRILRERGVRQTRREAYVSYASKLLTTCVDHASARSTLDYVLVVGHVQERSASRAEEERANLICVRSVT